MKTLMWLVALCCLSGVAVAQERTAGGSLQTESSWTALRTMIGKTDGDVSMIKIDLNAMKACAAQKKVWDPNKGCVNIDTSLYDSVVSCGDLGKIYDKSAGGCVSANATAPTCRLSVTPKAASSGRFGNNNTVSCPSGAYTDITRSDTGDCPGSTYSCTRTEYNCVAVVCN